MALRRLLLSAAAVLPIAFGGEPRTQNLYPAGGGSFEVTLSACKDKAPILNGRLNHTGASWLYIEIQVKVTHGSSTAAYRFNLERIGEKGAAMRQPLEGMSKVDCESIQLGGMELIAAQKQ